MHWLPQATSGASRPGVEPRQVPPWYRRPAPPATDVLDAIAKVLDRWHEPSRILMVRFEGF
jgi:hypothetical protein